MPLLHLSFHRKQLGIHSPWLNDLSISNMGCVSLCAIIPPTDSTQTLSSQTNTELTGFFFFLPAVFGVAETLLSCFLPSLALKLAIALLICVGHNTGKQGCFLLHHFLRINTFQQWLYWLRKRHVVCVVLAALPRLVHDTRLSNVI